MKTHDNADRTVRLIAVTAIAATGILWGCGGSKSGDEESTTIPRVPVQVTTLREGDIASTVTASGQTIPMRRERILAPTAGRVVALGMLEGATVHRGDLVAVLRTKESQAVADGAREMLRLATNDRERESSRRALVLADSIEPRVYIRATCDGVVATRSVMEGEYVAEHTELLSIVDLSSMVFQAEVPIGNAGSLRLRLPAIVALSQFDGDGLPAVVDGILPQADGESQSITVRLRFTGLTAEQNRKIKVNVQGTAEITTGCHRGVMLVDRNAVLHDDATHRSSIVLMTKDSLAHTVDVDQGLANDSLAEVSGAGLRAGMAVIRDGNYALAESTRVTLVRP